MSRADWKIRNGGAVLLPRGPAPEPARAGGLQVVQHNWARPPETTFESDEAAEAPTAAALSPRTASDEEFHRFKAALGRLRNSPKLKAQYIQKFCPPLSRGQLFELIASSREEIKADPGVLKTLVERVPHCEGKGVLSDDEFRAFADAMGRYPARLSTSGRDVHPAKVLDQVVPVVQLTEEQADMLSRVIKESSPFLRMPFSRTAKAGIAHQIDRFGYDLLSRLVSK